MKQRKNAAAGMHDAADELDLLNPEQREAVCHPAAPLLILAGAGTGKTRVLTYRVARLIGKGADPGSILAVTFTNKAAGEMRERILGLAGQGASRCWIGTFHSISARILRREGPHLGYTGAFSIYDSSDQKRLLKRVLDQLGLSERQTPINLLHSKISNAKNKLIAPKDYKPGLELFGSQIATVYQSYQDHLRAANAMDFDDLIMNTVVLFRNHPEVALGYRKRFAHVLIDEYQDTNMAQFHWAQLLVPSDGSITVVGDDDQSIYGWRGADITNILSFERIFPTAKAIRLEQNYRSTPEILQAANSVIANNKGRKGKRLWTQAPSGKPVSVIPVEDEVDEAEQIAQTIVAAKGRSSADFAVLYRTNAQSRAVEDALRNRGIPHVIIGGLRFYERKEVKDVLAYFRLLVNPADDLSLERVINVPRRGIGEKTVEAVRGFAGENALSLYQALARAGEIEDIPDAASKRLTSFYSMLEGLRAVVPVCGAADMARTVLEETGYTKELAAEDTDEAQERVRNVEELVYAVERFCERTTEPTLQSFLEEVSLMSDIDEWDNKKEAVSLMTLHCAKGLEFPVVFIAGLEQGLLPLMRSMDGNDDVEEERRLFYVGLTRARQEAHLLHARNRRRYGTSMAGIPSMFLNELDPEVVQQKEQVRFIPPPPVRRETPPAVEQRRAAAAMPKYEDFSQEEKTYRVGGYVRHQAWGNGKILDVSGFGLDTKLTISFGNEQKKVVARYANLEIL